ncbi:hypothetical protein CYMTET_25783 [Cymbomonas tetramitiformis]|uniref:Uncharacterized protein n=1 Tax=Cymbomonas tetramitiformis TaxID=36881 RepID=A0AAE0FTC5_9CHLO|nr:hypothetical protein CYMTET_25783 [Cymbomonas tetramitiformis]
MDAEFFDILCHVPVAKEDMQLYGTQTLWSRKPAMMAEADQVSDFEFNQFGGWSSLRRAQQLARPRSWTADRR